MNGLLENRDIQFEPISTRLHAAVTIKKKPVNERLMAANVRMKDD